jgi:hypothetical protein
MPPDMKNSAQLISLALKEYDALRKEIEARADVTKVYGWPVILLAFGAIAGFKSELVSVNAALTFIPAVVMTIAALDANANHDKTRARKAIALVEDRIFILSGAPALCHESMEFFKLKNQAIKQLILSFAYVVLYLSIEIPICIALLPKADQISWARTILFVGVLSVPATLHLYSSVGIYTLLTTPFSTRLLECIESSKNLDANEEQLLYDTETINQPKSAFRNRKVKL